MRHSGSGNDKTMMQHEMDACQETYTLEEILAEFRTEPLPPPESPPSQPPSGSGNIGRIYRRTRASVQGRPVRLGLCLVLTLCSLTLGVLRCEGLLEQFPSWTLLTYLEMSLLLCCTLLAADAIAGSLVELPRSGFQLTCLMPLLILLALADSILSLQAPRATYCPLVCLDLCAALHSAQLRDRALCSTLEPAKKGAGHVLARDPAFWKDQPGICACPWQEDAFLRSNRAGSEPERHLGICYAVFLMLCLLLAGLTSPTSPAGFVRILTAGAAAGTPLAGFLFWARPWAILTKQLQQQGAALYGWPGVKAMGSRLVVPIRQSDLFPGEHLKLNGMKIYSHFQPEHVIACAEAVLRAAGCSLAPLFQQLLAQRGAAPCTASRFRWYNLGGIGGEIDRTTLLVGNLRFMAAMGVELPAGTRVQQAVYVAIDGELAGLFAVHYAPARAVAEALHRLCRVRSAAPVLAAQDFLLTQSMLKSRFRLHKAQILVPDLDTQWAIGQQTPSEHACACLLTGQTSFPSLTLAVSGSQSLCSAARWGLALCLLSSLGGVLLVTLAAAVQATELLSLTCLLLYSLTWLLPGLLITGWTQNC